MFIDPQERDRLYRSSVLVTGAHYSLTTLLGSMLGLAPGFNMVHEPDSFRPTLSFPTIAPSCWYQFFDDAQYPQLRAALIGLMFADNLGAQTLRRLAQVRSGKDGLRVLRFVQRQLPMRLRPRPAIFKAPYLGFSARSMQRADNMRVVIGVRHPCAWIESAVRRNGGFNVPHLLQPAVVEAVPEFADRLALHVRAEQPPLQQAILTWQVIFTFHARYLLGNERTALFRQEDLVAQPWAEARRLFAFAQTAVPKRLDRFIERSFHAREVDFVDGKRNYTQRDGWALVRKWRQRLSAEDQRLIRSETEELAAVFGYGEDDWTEPLPEPKLTPWRSDAQALSEPV